MISKFEKANQFTKDNLVELCQDLRKRGDGSILPADALLFQLAGLCSFVEHRMFQLAETLIQSAAIDYVLKENERAEL